MIEEEEHENTLPRPAIPPQIENTPPEAEAASPPETQSPANQNNAPAEESSPPAEVEIDPAATISVPIPVHEEPVLETTTRATQEEPVTVEPPSLPSMDIDDLLALNIVSDPQVSPDGASIAFTLQSNLVEQDREEYSIWVVSSSGGKSNPPRQLTTGAFYDIQPRWSPDGQTLAFLRKHQGTMQLYLLSMHGGEARQISTLPHGITEYSWHPGGRLFLVHSLWKPGDATENSDLSSDEMVQLTTRSTRLDDYQNGCGKNQGRYLQLWLVPLEGKPTRLTSEPVDLVQSCWSPDGTEIVFCANRRADPDLSASTALWVLTLATGQLRRLTPEEGWAQMPSWSPDGEWIAYLFSSDSTEAGNIVPQVVAVRGDTVTPQTAVAGAEHFTCQAWIVDELRSEWLVAPQWYPDSQSLLVPVQERGQVHLYRLDRATNTSHRLTGGNGRYVSPHISRNGQSITMIRADWFTPGDIWCMAGIGDQLRKLTRINDAVLQSHQLVRPRRISWQSFDGLEIEGWLYLPSHIGQTKVPLILAPHGGPSVAWGDSYVHEFQVLAGRGYAVLAPNIRGSAGYGDEFSRKQLNDWGGADFRDLIAGLDHVIAHEPIDAERLGLNGLSYGGYLVNWTLTQTERFKAAVSRNGISSLESLVLLSDKAVGFALAMEDETLRRERSPLVQVERITTPLLLLHAEDDLRCPLNEAQQLFVALRKRKRVVELVRYHHTSHLMDWPGIGSPRQRVDRLRRTVQWFERYL